MLLELLDGVPQFRQVLSALGRSFSAPVYAAGLTGAQRAMLAYGISQRKKQPVLLITPDEPTAAKMYEDIFQLCSGERCALYPAKDFRFRGAEGASGDYEQRRLSVLGRILLGEFDIVVSSAEAAMQFTLPPGTYKYNTFTLRRGDSADIRDLAERLSKAGYERRAQVDGPCQFSVRGGILDFYSPQEQNPARIEFWGDEIDSVAFFDLETQRRTAEVESISIAPAREVLPDSKAVLISVLKEAYSKLRGKHGVAAKAHIEEDLQRLDSGLGLSAPDRYLPLIYKFPASLFDYMPNAVVCVSEYITLKGVLKSLAAQQNEDISILFEEGILFPGCDRFSIDQTELNSVLDSPNTVLIDSFVRTVGEVPVRTVADFGALTLSPWGGELESLLDDIKDYMARKYTVVVLCGTERAAHALTTDLINNNVNAAFARDGKISPGTVFVTEGSLSCGT